MENQSGRIFKLVALLVVMAALLVAIWLLGRTLLNMSGIGRQASPPTAAAATRTPSPTPTPTPTRPTPSPSRVAGLSEAPAASQTPTPAPPALSNRGDRLPPRLQVAAASPAATPLGGGWQCRVSIAPLELREGPGPAYGLIELLAAGDPLTASKQIDKAAWVLVETEQRQVGWVYGPCIVCQNDLAGLPVAAGLTAQPVTVASPRPAAAPTLPPTPTPPAGSATPALSQDYWLGEYFDNASLEGQPVLVRQDPVDLEFNWFLDSPGPGVPADNFSARWSRLADFLDGGDYRFYAEADDGVKISVDGQLVLYNWNLFAPITYQGDLHDVSPGLHTVTVEYFESGGHTRIKVWAERGALQDPNWTGQYYANPTWQEPPLLTRPDDNIDFDWGDGAPAAGLSQSDFSIRWRRNIFFAEAGRYRFWAEVERLDRVKIWLDGWLLVDEAKEERGVVEGYFGRLEPGFHTIIVEYADDSGPAKIKFDWERQ